MNHIIHFVSLFKRFVFQRVPGKVTTSITPGNTRAQKGQKSSFHSDISTATTFPTWFLPMTMHTMACGHIGTAKRSAWHTVLTWLSRPVTIGKNVCSLIISMTAPACIPEAIIENPTALCANFWKSERATKTARLNTTKQLKGGTVVRESPKPNSIRA